MALPVAKLSPVDEDLNSLEKDIRVFKIEYEQFFGGGRPRPPSDTEWRIDQMIKRYGERPTEINFAQRFRFNNLSQTYSKFREVFRKRQKTREEGTVQRHFGAAARTIETERKKKGRRRADEKGPERSLATVTLSDPTQQLREVEQLYKAYQQAQSKSAQAKPVGRGQFLEFLERRAEEFRKKSGDAGVEYSVVMENGKARLKARVKN